MFTLGQMIFWFGIAYLVNIVFITIGVLSFVAGRQLPKGNSWSLWPKLAGAAIVTQGVIDLIWLIAQTVEVYKQIGGGNTEYIVASLLKF